MAIQFMDMVAGQNSKEIGTAPLGRINMEQWTERSVTFLVCEAA